VDWLKRMMSRRKMRIRVEKVAHWMACCLYCKLGAVVIIVGLMSRMLEKVIARELGDMS
jgi:hypothetical protein